MKASIADQLKEMKFDFLDYARLPIREDVIVFKKGNEEYKEIMKQWEKLVYLQKHLRIIDKYIHKNKGETLSQWLQNNNTGLSKMVLDKIGNHNDETGGITMYFLNLQNFYDSEEEKYDKMEEDSNIPADIHRVVKELRDGRIEKRRNRKKARKIRMKDLKTDGKGYLYVESEEPPVQEEKTPKEQNEKNESVDKIADTVVKTKKNIGIWIAGIVITITAISILSSNKK